MTGLRPCSRGWRAPQAGNWDSQIRAYTFVGEVLESQAGIDTGKHLTEDCGVHMGGGGKAT